MEVNEQLQASAAFPPEDVPRYAAVWRVYGQQSWCGSCRERENCSPGTHSTQASLTLTVNYCAKFCQI